MEFTCDGSSPKTNFARTRKKFCLRIYPKNVTIRVVSAIYGVSPSAEAWYEIVSGLFTFFPPRCCFATAFLPPSFSVWSPPLSGQGHQ